MRPSDEIVEKMEKFVNRIAQQYSFDENGRPLSDTAGLIMAELRYEQEPDLHAAERIYAENCNKVGVIDMILKGIKLGRELEADR